MELHDKYEGDWKKIVPIYQESRKPNADAISELSKQNFIVLRDKMADPEFITRRKIITYLTENYPDLFTSQYSMLAFRHE